MAGPRRYEGIRLAGLGHVFELLFVDLGGPPRRIASVVGKSGGQLLERLRRKLVAGDYDAEQALPEPMEKGPPG